MNCLSPLLLSSSSDSDHCPASCSISHPLLERFPLTCARAKVTQFSVCVISVCRLLMQWGALFHQTASPDWVHKTQTAAHPAPGPALIHECRLYNLKSARIMKEPLFSWKIAFSCFWFESGHLLRRSIVIDTYYSMRGERGANCQKNIIRRLVTMMEKIISYMQQNII